MKTSELCKKNACCGCGACATVCPKDAISLVEDKYGFVYPKIDESVCINCGTCKKVCVFSIKKKSDLCICYACVNQDDNQIMKSASGGVFAAIASEFLKTGGFVCGASVKIENGVITVEHEIINKLDDLSKLQGSKYVQSNTMSAFRDIKNLLKKGERVLFSGTPCQVDAVKSLYRKYIGKSLFTIDIICHGVPSQKFLNGYLCEYQKRLGKQLTYIDFRNKKYGWGKTGIAKFGNKEMLITPENSSYYSFFMESEISRENCYLCPYANLNRVGDLTVGDYWGVTEFSRDLIEKNNLSEEKGISCLIVNNKNGRELLKKFSGNILLLQIDVLKATIYNTQLREPARHTSKRKWIMETFADKGYAPIEKVFQRQLFIKLCKKKIKQIIPKSIKYAAKKFLREVNKF